MFSQVTPGCSGDFSLARKKLGGPCWTMDEGMLLDVVGASDSVDGWTPAPVEVGSFCHYWQGFIAPRWCRISSINSRVVLVLCEAAFGSWKTWVFSRIWMYNSEHLNAGGLNQLLLPIRVENRPECARIIEDHSFKRTHCQIYAHQQKLPSPFFLLPKRHETTSRLMWATKSLVPLTDLWTKKSIPFLVGSWVTGMIPTPICWVTSFLEGWKIPQLDRR